MGRLDFLGAPAAIEQLLINAKTIWSVEFGLSFQVV